VQVYMAVEHRAEAVQEGDGAEPRVDGTRVSASLVTPAAVSRSRSISARKIFVRALTAEGRSAR
jgi:hypothetical protein